jgi:hypothetical protein
VLLARGHGWFVGVALDALVLYGVVLFDALRGLFDPLLVRRGAAAGVCGRCARARAAAWVGAARGAAFALSCVGKLADLRGLARHRWRADPSSRAGRRGGGSIEAGLPENLVCLSSSSVLGQSKHLS